MFCRQISAKSPWQRSANQKICTAPSPKTHNNYLIVLRGIFRLEYRGAASLNNPLIGIENMPLIKRLPDPLTVDERSGILADMQERYDIRVVAYFQWIFYSGTRPEEATRCAGPMSIGAGKSFACDVPCLKRLGIRWRRQYNTRHTYATVALMAGVPPAYIAAQLGYSVKMLLDRYARWLPHNDPGTARALLVAAMEFVPNRSQ